MIIYHQNLIDQIQSIEKYSLLAVKSNENTNKNCNQQSTSSTTIDYDLSFINNLAILLPECWKSTFKEFNVHLAEKLHLESVHFIQSSMRNVANYVQRLIYTNFPNG